MNDKQCKILGYQECVAKDTGEALIRICIVIDSKRENYYGKESLYIFLPNDSSLILDLKKAIDNPHTPVFYETTDNIVSGKTKVSKIIVQ